MLNKDNNQQTIKYPRVMIAAASSGTGKTLLTCGLLKFLLRNDYKPHSFKCGPDYIDLMFHKKVLGIEGDNLDSWLIGDGDIRNILARPAMMSDSDKSVALIEGVMGLYDGLSVDGIEASSYEVALKTGTPIVLIVDGKGAGRTLLSVIKGILADDKAGIIRGIIINRITASYYQMIRDSFNGELEAAGYRARIIGFLGKMSDVNLDSRHLGLKLPEEIQNLNRMIDMVADEIERDIDTAALLNIIHSAEELSYTCKDCDINQYDQRLRLAVAMDEAFCFYYQENLRLLKDQGVDLVAFSPLRDEKLPENISGILLGGGYPELHLSELMNNVSMRQSIKEAISSGMPSIAECGGFMYLHESIEDDAGKVYDMVGAIKGKCHNEGHLVRFGYAQFMPVDEGLLSGNIRGHEFHYYDTTNNGEDCVATKPSGNRSWKCMMNAKNSLWGFAHLYYRSNPVLVESFVNAMEAYGRKNV